MLKHWYVYIAIAVVAELLLWGGNKVCDKYKIIKWKSLRFLLALFIATIISWGVFDLIIGGE